MCSPSLYTEELTFPDDLEDLFHTGWLTTIPVNCRALDEPDRPVVTFPDKCLLTEEHEGSHNISFLVPNEEEDQLRPSPSMEQHLSGALEEPEFYTQKDSTNFSLSQGIKKNITEAVSNPGLSTAPVAHDCCPGSVSAGHAENQYVVFLPRTKPPAAKHLRKKKRTMK